MTQITLNIPDNDLGFFMKLIEKFNYEPLIKFFYQFHEEMKSLLDERRATSKKEDFVSWEDVKK